MTSPSCSHRNCSPSRVSLLLGLMAALACGTVYAAKPDHEKGKGKGNGKAVGQNPDFIPPGHRRAPVEVVVKQAPPALRVEVQIARPSAAHVWVAGYWSWETTAYAWTPAVWMLPPEPKAVWVQPRYESRAGVQLYITGFWRL